MLPGSSADTPLGKNSAVVLCMICLDIIKRVIFLYPKLFRQQEHLAVSAASLEQRLCLWTVEEPQRAPNGGLLPTVLGDLADSDGVSNVTFVDQVSGLLFLYGVLGM